MAGGANRWIPPRTPWGDPDLQGIWNNSTITELERPSELSAKGVLTDEEAAALERKAAQNRVDRSPKAGDPGTYNQAWFDRGAKVVPTKRTSLIIDPQDGRLPPLTESGRKRDEERFKRLGQIRIASLGDRAALNSVSTGGASQQRNAHTAMHGAAASRQFSP